MAKSLTIPRPVPGERVTLNIIQGLRGFGVWWSLADADQCWVDGGHISNHRTRESAEDKLQAVETWLVDREQA